MIQTKKRRRLTKHAMTRSSSASSSGSDGGAWREEAASDAISDREDKEVWIISSDPDLHDRVVALIRADKCDARCLECKVMGIEEQLCSLSMMIADERKTSITTALAAAAQVEVVERRRGSRLSDNRRRSCYHLSGRCVAFRGARAAALRPHRWRYKRVLRAMSIALQPHSNKLNINAKRVDHSWLVSWFKSFATDVGDVVPVRVSSQQTDDNRVKQYFITVNYIMLQPT